MEKCIKQKTGDGQRVLCGTGKTFEFTREHLKEILVSYEGYLTTSRKKMKISGVNCEIFSHKKLEDATYDFIDILIVNLDEIPF